MGQLSRDPASWVGVWSEWHLSFFCFKMLLHSAGVVCVQRAFLKGDSLRGGGIVSIMSRNSCML